MPFISSIRKNYDVSDKTGTLEKFEITGGNSISTAGGYRIHTFSSVGEAELAIKLKSNASMNTIGLQAKTLQVEYMILAGGGAGGSRHGSGGGGAGGYLSAITTVSTGSIPVNVGAGAAGQANAGEPIGGSSTFGLIQTRGGGRGASYYDYDANEGGSGGGGCGHTGGGGGGIGGRGHDIRGYDLDAIRQGAGTAGQGFRGGVGTNGYPNGYGGLGGPGISTPIAGGTRGGGGGGAAWNPGTPDKSAAGGAGGGGAGVGPPAANGISASGSNNGSGGGGGNSNPSQGGSGSPGLVVVRYLT